VPGACRNNTYSSHTHCCIFWGLITRLAFSSFPSLCHFSLRIIVIGPDTHTAVILPCIVPAAFCMLELVDVICLTHGWIERCVSVSLITLDASALQEQGTPFILWWLSWHYTAEHASYSQPLTTHTNSLSHYRPSLLP
jgi:hypothetical protein